MRGGDFDFGEIAALAEKLNKLGDSEAFLCACAKELATRLLAKVIKRTPVGKNKYTYETKKIYDYWREEGTDEKAGKRHRFDTGRTKVVRHTVKVGGTLRRGWTGGAKQNAVSYAQSLPVAKQGGAYVITICNPVEYAPYVEYGHRTRNHKGWVDGKFFLTISEKEIQNAAPDILERKLERYLKECLE